MLVFALLPAALADDTFHPGAGPDAVSYGDLLARGVVRGRTGRLLVRGDAAEVAKVSGVAQVTTLRGGLLRVSVAPGADDLAVARALHGRPGVDFAVPDLLLPLVPATLPDDPWLGEEWHLENTGQGGRVEDVDVDATLAWTFATGAGQRIAVLDSGVQVDHPDLLVVPGHDYLGDDDDPTPDTSDAGPHGTGCAGIAAATGDNGYGVAGVAWEAEVYAIRLIGGESSSQDLYDAFVEAVDAGAGVLSNSWGFGTSCETIPNYAVFGEMFDYAEHEGRDGLGAVVAFAAGNGGCDIAGDGMLANRELVVVAAVEGTDQRASYSSYGDAVDIAAPTALLTTDITPGGYGSYADDDAFMDGFSGTSGATPVVAGVVALMLEANPRITAAEVREVLCATAVRIDEELAAYDAEGRSPYYGCGRIDAGAAVATVANGAPAAPVPRLVAETVPAERVILAWDPAADPDGDVLGYDVSWTVDGDAHAETTTATRLDLSGRQAEGAVVTWTVTAVDPWGPGATSAPVTFTVEEAEEEETGGCAVAPGAGGMAGVLLAVAALSRRRR